MLVDVKGLRKYYGGQDIFVDASLQLKKGEKVGVVGLNGSGKTTLIRIIAGLEEHNGAERMHVDPLCSMGYLEQHAGLDESHSLIQAALTAFSDIVTLEDEIELLGLEAAEETDLDRQARLLEDCDLKRERVKREGGFGWRNRVSGVLEGMGFPPEDHQTKRVGMLSGGERTKLALCRLLARMPDILLLDEPTNHLDLHAVEWLEGFLREYQGTLMMVSHDRWLLNSIVNRIVEVEDLSLRTWPGGYDEYIEGKQRQFEAEQKKYEQTQRRVRRMERFITRFRAKNTLATRVKSKEKALQRLKREAPKPPEAGGMSLTFREVDRAVHQVLSLEIHHKGFETSTLIKDSGFTLSRGERVSLVGPNGCGKTTLMRMIAGLDKDYDGFIRIGEKTTVGYFSQNARIVDPRNTPEEEVMLANPDFTPERARTVLGAFMFDEEDWVKEVSKLSGGERSKLALCKLLVQTPNVLLLDEPTNHLDIPSREALESALIDFPGTALIVSHDRYFLERVCTRTVAFRQMRLKSYPGPYSYFREKTLDEKPAEPIRTIGSTSSDSRSAREWKEAKRLANLEVRRERRKADLEERIRIMEGEIETIHREMESPDLKSNHLRLAELQERLEERKRKLEDLTDSWLEMELADQP